MKAPVILHRETYKAVERLRAEAFEDWAAELNAHTMRVLNRVGKNKNNFEAVLKEYQQAFGVYEENP